MRALILTFGLRLLPAAAVAQTFPKWAGPLTGIADYTGQQFSLLNPFPVTSQSVSPTKPDYIKPAPYTVNSLAFTSIVSGTPQTVLAASLASAGGFIYAATTNTGLVCVNPKGTAGTSTSGDTSCFAAGGQFNIPPSANVVSANCSTGTCTISGFGFQ